jgi:hypothetical protein
LDYIVQIVKQQEFLQLLQNIQIQQQQLLDAKQEAQQTKAPDITEELFKVAVEKETNEVLSYFSSEDVIKEKGKEISQDIILKYEKYEQDFIANQNMHDIQSAQPTIQQSGVETEQVQTAQDNAPSIQSEKLMSIQSFMELHYVEAFNKMVRQNIKSSSDARLQADIQKQVLERSVDLRAHYQSHVQSGLENWWLNRAQRYPSPQKMKPTEAQAAASQSANPTAPAPEDSQATKSTSPESSNSQETGPASPAPTASQSTNPIAPHPTPAPKPADDAIRTLDQQINAAVIADNRTRVERLVDKSEQINGKDYFYNERQTTSEKDLKKQAAESRYHADANQASIESEAGTATATVQPPPGNPTIPDRYVAPIATAQEQNTAENNRNNRLCEQNVKYVLRTQKR